MLYCLSMRTNHYYTIKQIKKQNGGFREISIPSYTLHIVQRWILVEILNKILPTNRAMAFRKGKDFGHKQNAFYHADTLYGLTLDLKDFFPSITSNKIYTLFSDLGYNNFAATILTNLCTLDGKLPQGSACSPALSNLICITLDKRLIGLCEKRGIRYSRYADDMYFSCDDKALLLKNRPIIKKIIEDEDFIINEKKTHFHTPSNGAGDITLRQAEHPAGVLVLHRVGIRIQVLMQCHRLIQVPLPGIHAGEAARLWVHVPGPQIIQPRYSVIVLPSIQEVILRPPGFRDQFPISIVGVGVCQVSFFIQKPPHISLAVVQVGGSFSFPYLGNQSISPAVGSQEFSFFVGFCQGAAQLPRGEIKRISFFSSPSEAVLLLLTPSAS